MVEFKCMLVSPCSEPTLPRDTRKTTRTKKRTQTQHHPQHTLTNVSTRKHTHTQMHTRNHVMRRQTSTHFNCKDGTCSLTLMQTRNVGVAHHIARNGLRRDHAQVCVSGHLDCRARAGTRGHRRHGILKDPLHPPCSTQPHQ